jgi:RNA polymerase sigma factor (sigma-70 family)
VTAIPLFTKHRWLATVIAREWFIPGADSDDVQQEATIGLWEAATSYDPVKGPFKPFANLVIRRRLADCLKHAQRGSQLILTQSARDQPMPYLHQVADIAEDRDDLHRILETIDHKCTAWEKHCVIGIAVGLDYRELGPTKQVDNGLMRARKKLRAVA